MFIRKYWLPLSVFLIVVVMVGLYVLQTRPEKAPIKIYKAVKVEKPKAEVPVGDTSQGGHFHADGTWHEGPHEAPPAHYQRGDLTYHADLLDKHPVEALRQHAQEIGHWSAEYIPPFPPEDTEAAGYARNVYLTSFYEAIGEIDNPEYKRAISAEMYFFSEIIKKRYPTNNLETEARHWDLSRLHWRRLEDESAIADIHNPILYPYGVPSEFNEEYQAHKREMLKLQQAQQE